MKGLGMGGHQGVMQKDEWLTPPEIIKSLGEFDLDPCAPINPPWLTAKNRFTIEDDGLLQEWKGRVWMNPPYGNEASKWLKKLSDHNNGIALIFARVETDAWFQHIWPHATGVFFFRGRLHFHHVNGDRAPNNSGAPSALVAYGVEAWESIRHSGLDGKFIDL